MEMNWKILEIDRESEKKLQKGILKLNKKSYVKKFLILRILFKKIMEVLIKIRFFLLEQQRIKIYKSFQ